jgi:p21-activated kinase 1
MNTGTNGIPPPRPTRAGTLPYDNGVPGMQPMSASQGLARANAAAGGLSPAGGGVGFPPHSAPPPLQHQPFSSPANPYSTQGIEKGIEDTKLGLGMGMPMNVVEPSKEKELPNAPNATRSRSGTGKSQKGKSIFGLSFSGMSSCLFA